MIRVIVDRFEGQYAVVELPDGRMQLLPASILPEETKEGDVVDISVNHEATKHRAQDIHTLKDELWEEQ